jgi:tRNA A37 threonylcarbamoyladenosine biosynthesis protein TsaE
MDPKHILLIEWGEKFERFTKERDAEIAIEHLGEDHRRVVLNEELPELPKSP